MSSKYKILALIDLQHDYYADGQSRDFSIMPAPDTANAARSKGILYKIVGNKLAVLIRVNNAGMPEQTFLPGQRLSFYLMVENVHFYNTTNIDLQPGGHNRYYFHNLKNNNSGKAYLTAPVAAYNSSNTYAIGSLAANGGDTYEAIRASNSGNAHGTADAGYWVKKAGRQYAGKADLIALTDRIYTFAVSAPATGFAIKVLGLNSETGGYDQEVLPAVSETYETAQAQVQVKLDGLSAGRYMIDVNGEQKEVYFDPVAIYRGAFAMIDLYNHLPGTDPCALLDNTGKVKEKEFTISFTARSVIWKYFVSSDITAITDSNGKYHFLPDGSSKSFYSDKPIPLSDKPVSSLSLTSTRLGVIDGLANPATDRLSSIELTEGTYYCIEKYLYY